MGLVAHAADALLVCAQAWGCLRMSILRVRDAGGHGSWQVAHLACDTSS